MKANKILYMTYRQYRKAKALYSRRKAFMPICPIGDIAKTLDLPDNADFYIYKNRVFIFRRGHSVASFVITKDRVYNPFEACGAVIIDRVATNIICLSRNGKEFSLPRFLIMLNTFKDYKSDLYKGDAFDKVDSVLSENGINLSHNCPKGENIPA